MARGRKKRQRKTVTVEPILNATEEASMDANVTNQETQASDFDANGDDARGSMTRSKMAKLGEIAALGYSSGVRKKRGRKSKAEKEALKLLAMAENANANDEGNLEGENANENDGVINQKQRRGRKRGIVKDKEVVMVSGNKKGLKDREDEARAENETESLSLNETETESQQKEEPLAVKVKDTSTGEIVTQKLQANQIWYLEKTEKVIVELNGNGQGMDSGSNLLVRFLGKLAQNSKVCPLSVERWNQMPEDNSLQQWNYIAENFEFDYAAGIKWVMSTLGERWKAHKYRLRRKYFYPNRSMEDILANPPPGVDCADWTAFVNHYKDDKMRIRSLQNKLSRKKLKISHAGGSKSNARRGHEMELQLGRPVCRSEVILSTLKKKDGNYVNEEGKTLADKILENLSQDQERAASSGVPSKILAYPDDAIGKVYGTEHSGRVRGLGAGACPSSVFEGIPRPSIAVVKFGGSNQQGVEDLKEHVKTLEVKLEGYEETKEQLLQTQKQLATLCKFLSDKFGNELPSFNQDVPSICMN